MRSIIVLLGTTAALAMAPPRTRLIEPPCEADTTAVTLRRQAIVRFLAYEDHSEKGLPYRPAAEAIVVVTDFSTCTAAVSAMGALGGDPPVSVLVLHLADSGYAIVGTSMLDDTVRYFTEGWQYLFTLHGLR